MSRPREENIKAAVMQCFTVLLLSLGLSLTTLKALLPLQALWPAALLCVLFSLAFEGLYLPPRPEFRLNSLDTLEAERPNRRPISRNDRPLSTNTSSISRSLAVK